MTNASRNATLLLSILGLTLGCGAATKQSSSYVAGQTSELQLFNVQFGGDGSSEPIATTSAQSKFAIKLPLSALFKNPSLPSGMIILARNGHEIERRPLTDSSVEIQNIDSSSNLVLTEFTATTVGWYEVFFEFGQSTTRHAYAVVGLVPTKGGVRIPIQRSYAGPYFFVVDGKLGFNTLVWSPFDEDSIARIEWWHDGKLMSSNDERYLESRMPHLQMWGITPRSFVAPEQTREGGTWEVRYKPNIGTGFAATVQLAAGGEFKPLSEVLRIDGATRHTVTPRQLPADAATQAELNTQLTAKLKARTIVNYRPTSAELRGSTRSQDLFAARTTFDTETTPVGFDRSQFRFRAQAPRESVQQYIAAYDSAEALMYNYADKATAQRAQRAKQLAPAMNALITMHGAPWTTAEHPIPEADTPLTMLPR